MKFYLFSLVCIVCCFSCSHKASQQDITSIDTIPMLVMQIQKCSKLYTTEYKIHKIITHNDKMKLKGSFLKKDFSINLPLGNRKIAIPMDAIIKTYIDFNDFSVNNVQKKDGKLEIILPDPKVALTATRINHQEIKQYVPLMRKRFTDEELTQYEQQGRKAIIKDITTMGIIETARECAARTLIPLFEQMGYQSKDITISFRKQFTPNDIRLLLN